MAASESAQACGYLFAWLVAAQCWNKYAEGRINLLTRFKVRWDSCKLMRKCQLWFLISTGRKEKNNLPIGAGSARRSCTSIRSQIFTASSLHLSRTFDTSHAYFLIKKLVRAIIFSHTRTHTHTQTQWHFSLNCNTILFSHCTFFNTVRAIRWYVYIYVHVFIHIQVDFMPYFFLI